MIDPDSSEIRALVRRAQRAPESHAPSFDEVWAAAGTQHRRQQRRTLIRGWILAGLVAGVLGTVAIQQRAPRREAPVSTAAAERELPWRSANLLTEWRAPSDALVSSTDFPSLHY